MLDTGPTKQYFKDATPEEATAMYQWVTGAMEVRGLIQILGTRKKRSDAGQPRDPVNGAAPLAGDQLNLREPGQ